MKRSATAIFLPIFLLLTADLSAQWAMTFTAGLSPQQSSGTPYIFVNRSSPRDEFTFQLSQVKASALIGAGVTYAMKPFFVAAEAQYNRRAYVYDVAFTYPDFPRSAQAVRYTEKTHVIQVPLTLGVNLGIVEVTNGFVPQLIVSQDSELERLDGYREEMNAIQLGWTSGIGVRMANVRVGVNWQMDFRNYGDHIHIRDQSLALQGRRSRAVGMIGYVF